MNEKPILTREGYHQLEQELHDLKTRGREEIAARLNDVRDDTAPSDESLLFEAMTAQEQLEARIAQIERILATAEVIDHDPDPDSASPGDRVIVWDYAEKAEFAFDLLGSAEVAFGRSGVSIESPVGRALLNRRVGDIVEVQVPDGIARYQIRRLEQIK
jgi:transcription elongation factor GreA